jgi:methylated-DNA-protein-cysteine methyltransferase-like protein
MSNTKPAKENIYEIIYEIVRAVPKGRITTYGAVAAAIGVKSGARMVGYAMNYCGGLKPAVPAHRVVNRNGMLTGKHHFSPPEKMEQLLKKEGIKVKDDVVVDFKQLFWDPVKELL